MEPTLKIKELAQETHCSVDHAGDCIREWKAQKGIEVKSYTEIGAKNKDFAFVALNENPQIKSRDLAKKINCSQNKAAKYKKEYMETYPEAKEETVKAIIFSFLDKNIKHTLMDLQKLARCSEGTATKYRTLYIETHPKTKITTNNTIGIKNQKIIFSALDVSPTLKIKELAQLANCSIPVAYRWKQKWLEQHGAGPQEEA